MRRRISIAIMSTRWLWTNCSTSWISFSKLFVDVAVVVPWVVDVEVDSVVVAFVVVVVLFDGRG